MDFYTVKLRKKYFMDDEWKTSLPIYSLFVIADSLEVANAKVNQCIENQSTENMRFILDGDVHKVLGIFKYWK